MAARHAVAVAATLLGAASAVGMPSASAAPQPGTECTGAQAGTTSADGTLTCDGLRLEWLHVGVPIMQPGQPCTRLGDVTATGHEGTVVCGQAPAGLVWETPSR